MHLFHYGITETWFIVCYLYNKVFSTISRLMNCFHMCFKLYVTTNKTLPKAEFCKWNGRWRKNKKYYKNFLSSCISNLVKTKKHIKYTCKSKVKYFFFLENYTACLQCCQSYNITPNKKTLLNKLTFINFRARFRHTMSIETINVIGC